jgi:hypothetical protein
MKAEVKSQNRRRPALMLVICLLFFGALILSQPACVLITEGIYTRPNYTTYKCRATLMDTVNGERRTVVSSMLTATAPGAAERTFLGYDYNGDNVPNDADAQLDWRRYLRNNVVSSSSFTGRSWCVRPSTISCEANGYVVWRSSTPPAGLPEAELSNCFETTGPQLEVSAIGLSSDNRFSFPDTVVGGISAATLFTVTNRSAESLRVNAVDLIAGAHRSDFVKPVDDCAPTAAERMAGRGHLLASGGRCTFEMQYRPQHRDGVAECASGAVNDSCRRETTLFVTGEVDASRNAVTPVNLMLSGHAVGGGLSVAPELCFASAPALGACTPYQDLRIVNTGPGDLTLTSARLTQAGNRWEATMPFLMSFPLPMGFPLNVPVRFCNIANDPTDGEFTINSSGPMPTTVVRLVNPLTRTCP